MDTITLRTLMIRERLSVKDGTLSQRTAHLEKALRLILPPKDQSDRTCFRKVAAWLGQKCSAELFNPDEVLPRVIDFALEASSPGSNNCHAVFMSIIKKELRYPN